MSAFVYHSTTDRTRKNVGERKENCVTNVESTFMSHLCEEYSHNAATD
jgi:hypothetical protein